MKGMWPNSVMWPAGDKNVSAFTLPNEANWKTPSLYTGARSVLGPHLFHTVHPLLQSQTEKELHCKVCLQHHHQTEYKQGEFIFGGKTTVWSSKKQTNKGLIVDFRKRGGKDAQFCLHRWSCVEVGSNLGFWELSSQRTCHGNHT